MEIDHIVRWLTSEPVSEVLWEKTCRMTDLGWAPCLSTEDMTCGSLGKEEQAMEGVRHWLMVHSASVICSQERRGAVVMESKGVNS